MNTDPPKATPVDVTFFVPCYNEEDNVGPTLETLQEVAQERGLSYEVLVYDDGSTDGTGDVVRNYQRDHPKEPVELVVNERNRGLGFNYKAGAHRGTGRYYMLVNGDNAEPFETLDAILAPLGSADMVIPYFGARDVRRFRRRGVSMLFTFLVNLANGHRLKYYNGPVLHLRENVARYQTRTDGFAYQAELLTRLLDLGVSHQEVSVVNRDRQAGNTKAFAPKNLLRVSASLLRIWRRRW